MKHYRDDDWRGHTALTPLEIKSDDSSWIHDAPRSRAGRAARSQKCREAKIATLEEAITKAEAVGEQRRQEARAEGEQQSEANPPHGAVFPPTVSRRNAPSARMRP